MSNYDQIDKGKDFSLSLLNFQDSLDSINIIKYSSSYIEFPDIIIFSNKNETLRQILNPGIDILSVDEDDINLMVKDIESKEGYFIIEGALKPKGFIGFNLDRIKDNLILYKESKYFIIVNDMLFTTDSLEFHGSFFGGKSKLFLINKKELSYLKDFFNNVVEKG